ncbi:MAG: stage V sporulation protein AD [Clostridia bacterium]|nr:stage V sporulation protein AD [Clostridia bacterium]
MPERRGKYTISLSGRPTVLGYASVVGKKEGEGPLGDLFDQVFTDTRLGEKTWEKAESRLQKEALSRALNKAGFSPSQVDVLFTGDLLNQNIASTFGVRDSQIPLLNQFGACSTMAQTLAMASVFVDSGAADIAAAVTSSHFCTAERQFRFPLEYGGQRPATAQWTATASGAVLVGLGGGKVHIADVCIGCIVDLGITDTNNMGAAMAPAAADTLAKFFADTDTHPEDYDFIATGDLGAEGSALFKTLMARDGERLGEEYLDCGLLIYDRERQDVHAGGSGCGCSASVLCSLILGNMESGKWRDGLFIATGAMMSPTSSQQGESIPGIAHLIHLKCE